MVKAQRKLLYQYPEAPKTLLDPETIDNMNKFGDIFGDASDLRAENIKKIYNVVRTLMDNKTASVKCQTEQACMNNAVVYEYYSYGSDSESATKKVTTMEDEELSEMGSKVKKKLTEIGYLGVSGSGTKPSVDPTESSRDLLSSAGYEENTEMKNTFKFKGDKAKDLLTKQSSQ